MTDEMGNLEWLRKSSSEEWCGSALNKCADEIERLREENARLREVLKPFILETRPENNVYGYVIVFVKPEQLSAARAAIR